jgi:hypothetical protein
MFAKLFTRKQATTAPAYTEPTFDWWDDEDPTPAAVTGDGFTFTQRELDDLLAREARTLANAADEETREYARDAIARISAHDVEYLAGVARALDCD